MAIQQYTPKAAPAVQSTELREVVNWVQRELTLVANNLVGLNFLQLVVLHNEPLRPRDGMIVYADGTDWDPGSGEGIYGRVNGSWAALS